MAPGAALARRENVRDEHVLATLAALPLLHAECARTPALGFLLELEITSDQIASTPIGCGPCADCCHWSVPLRPPYIGRVIEHAAPMHYPEWLAWHWHAISHQRLNEPVSTGLNARVARRS